MQTTSKSAKGVILPSQTVGDLFARISTYFNDRQAPVMAVERGESLTLYLDDGQVSLTVSRSTEGGAA